MSALTKLDWKEYTTSIPAFLAMIAIPLTYSITTGIVVGFITYIFMMVFAKKIREIPVTLWVVGMFSVFSLILTVI